MKVLWLTNIPSPYRVDFFNEMGKNCDLTVLFEKGASDERDESWKNYRTEHFRAVILKGKSIGADGAVCPSVLKYLKRDRYDKIVVTNFSGITGLMAVFCLRAKRMRYYVESDGGFAKNGRGIKEKLKRFVITGAAGCFSTGKIHDDYYMQYGAKSENIYRYPFSSLKANDIEAEILGQGEKQAIREKLGMKENRIVVSVGQFIYRKGFDVLLNAVPFLPKDVGIYIIGGKPICEYLELKERFNATNVHFLDFKPKEELKEYYKAADMFVLPTREDIWGLVINEAMACGLPVVTTDKCIAGLELIRKPCLGRIVPTDDAEALSLAICDVLFADAKNSAQVLSTIRSYTVEKMAERHFEIWKNNDSER